MLDFDTTRLPTSKGEWHDFVNALTQTDDYSETHYLEMKSDLDMRAPRDVFKIAKFILAAGNRMPNTAAPYLDGHALMVLGVEHGAAKGILSPLEGKDLRYKIQPYTGVDTIAWSAIYIEVDSEPDRRVVIIVVDPPQWGDPIRTARKALRLKKPSTKNPAPCTNPRCPNPAEVPDTLCEDGWIFYRPDSETRQATSDDVALLVKRAVQDPRAEPNIEVHGRVLYFTCSPDLLDEYIAAWQHHLSETLDANQVPPSARRMIGDRRTPVQFSSTRASWESAVRARWSTLVEGAASLWYNNQISITISNASSVPLKRPDITIDLPGNIWAAGVTPREAFDPLAVLPSPPIDYGTNQYGSRADLAIPGGLGVSMQYQNFKPARTYGAIDYDNRARGEGVGLTVKLEDLRSHETKTVGPDDVILLTDDADAETWDGSWTLSAAEHNHAPYRGGITLDVVDIDVANTLRSLLNWPR